MIMFHNLLNKIYLHSMNICLNNNIDGQHTSQGGSRETVSDSSKYIQVPNIIGQVDQEASEPSSVISPRNLHICRP